MRSLLDLLRRGPPARAPRQPVFAPHAPAAAGPIDRGPIVDALGLPDGTPASEALLAAVAAEIHARRARTATLDGPPSPVATGLRIRRDGLPDWWGAGGNLMLCAADAHPVEVDLDILQVRPEGTIVVVGAGARIPRIALRGGPGLIVFGDRCYFAGGGFALAGPSTILIGEDSNATWLPNITAHNGGIIIVGADGMWGPGIVMMTDDTHEITDVASGARINPYAGRIVVDRHVWLGYQASLSGDCYVGPDSVIGQGALVRGVRLPGNAICSGRPARSTREGVTWSRQDRPPR